MAIATRRTHQHCRLDSAKIKRAQKALHAKTETEASSVLWTSRLRNMRRIAWSFRPRNVLSRVALKLTTSTARWVVRCSLPSSTLRFTSPRCVGETMQLSPSDG